MKHRPSSTHGFALVIALSLMAFILLLILSITTLVRVETQSANTQLAQLEARMNAQLGAMVALGDLQRYTGPDQRVTARSDILLAPGLSGPAGQQRWTGVWSSKEITNDSFDQKDGLDNRQARWLVSGNGPSATALDPSSPLSVETADLATLGGSVTNKSNINQDDTVKAPKVEILGDNNALAGHYAYWVSDEGVKARVNMADPHLKSPDSEAEYYRTAIAQVADPKAVTKTNGERLLMEGTDSWWKNGTQDPGKISSLKNISMFLEDDFTSNTRGELDEDPDVVNREYFHDFTVHSSGVLANTKDGGLKRDLSTALLDLPNDMKDGGANSLMFPPANGPSGPGEMNPGGPKWEQLSDYYKLAKDNFAGDSYEPIDLRMPTNEQVGFTPVITRSNFFVQGFAERNPAREEYVTQTGAVNPSFNWCGNKNPSTLPGSDLDDWKDPDHDWYCARGYRYSLGMFPLITLWNPYDRDMILGDLGLEFELPKIDIVEEPGSTTVIAATGIKTSKWNGTEGVRRWTVKFVIDGQSLPGGILKAGEAVNFSPPTNALYNASTPTDNLLVARESAPYVNGFFTETIEYNSDTIIKFWDNSNNQSPAQRSTNYSKWSRSRLSLNVSGGNGSLWRQLVMLYSSADTGTGNQFISGNRIKTIEIHGTGLFKNGWQQPRVILANRLMGINDNTDAYDMHIKYGILPNDNYLDPLDGIPPDPEEDDETYPVSSSYLSDFIGPQGDSKSVFKLGSTDLFFGNELCRDALAGCNPWGAVGAMRFPNVPIRTWANTGSESEIHLFLNMNPTAPVIHKEPNISWDQANQGMAESNVYSKGHIKPWVNADEKLYYDKNN